MLRSLCKPIINKKFIYINSLSCTVSYFAQFSNIFFQEKHNKNALTTSHKLVNRFKYCLK